MVGLTIGMKEKAIYTNTIIKNDSQNLDKLDEMVDKNLHSVDDRYKELRQLLDISKKSTCYYWSIIIFVIFAFFFMAIFIKFTNYF